MKTGARRLPRRARIGACALVLGAVLAVLLLVTARSRAAHETRGQVVRPRMNAYGVSTPAAENARFNYSGWVDFPGSEGYVQIDVLRRGNLEDEANSWAIDVARATISDTPIEVDGQNRYLWSTGNIQIFLPQSQPGAVPDNRFPDGGTARVRFIAVHAPPYEAESRTLLPTFDENGVETSGFPQLILADKNPSPATPPPGSPHPPPNYLNRGATGTTQDTEAYYRSVGTNFDGTGRSIRHALPDLDKFMSRYFHNVPLNCRVPRSGLSTYYFNAGDLGLGRRMRCLLNLCNGETACAVENFGAADTSGSFPVVVFNDFARSRRAVELDRPFATVAMVERRAMPRGSPNRIFFAVYDHTVTRIRDGFRVPVFPPPLALKAPLDNQALAGQGNDFIPGNCLTCHGSGRRSYQPPANRQPPRVREAAFLPFDLSSFRYYGTFVDFNSDATIDASREAQELRFKFLNALVFITDVNAEARDLIRGWYGGDFSRETFDDTFVPEGWTEAPDTRQLYRHVVATSCRGCHIVQNGGSIADPWPLRFARFDDFNSFKATIYDDVCRTHIMPNAEQTLKVAWRTSARPQLLNRLLIPFGCGWEPVSSALTTTALTGSRDGPSAEAVYLNYQLDSCGCATSECLQDVQERYLAPFATMQYDDPSAEERINALRSEALDCHQRVLIKDALAQSRLPTRDATEQRAKEEVERVLRLLERHP